MRLKLLGTSVTLTTTPAVVSATAVDELSIVTGKQIGRAHV